MVQGFAIFFISLGSECLEVIIHSPIGAQCIKIGMSVMPSATDLIRSMLVW
ncbi:MAG: hypothetical protein ABIA83_00395 [Patescibacteria group bacterium]